MPQLNSNTFIPLFEGYCRKNDIDGKNIVARIGKNPLRLKVLSTDESQRKGFMNSNSPKDGEGLLFVYDIEIPLTFWMKNVKFPLDILFFDSNLKLVDYQTMNPDDGSQDDLLPRYTSKKPARYAVEVPAGWCTNNLDTKNSDLSFKLELTKLS